MSTQVEGKSDSKVLVKLVDIEDCISELDETVDKVISKVGFCLAQQNVELSTKDGEAEKQPCSKLLLTLQGKERRIIMITHKLAAVIDRIEL